MKIAIIPVGEAASTIAAVIEKETGGQRITRHQVSECWTGFDALVFIGALGICVRTIAPLIQDKHTDPAVVCIDTTGRHVISVLSGHVGGANDLTKRLAAALGVVPVITTQSDNNGLWPLDTLGRKYDWTAVTDNNMNAVITAFVNRHPTALLVDCHDEGTEMMLRTKPAHVTVVNHTKDVTAESFQLFIIVSPFVHEKPAGVKTLQYVPKVAALGVGLAHQAAPEGIANAIAREMTGHGLMKECIREVSTIDIKQDEPFIHELKAKGLPVRLFTAEQLDGVEVPNPSEVVSKHVGTASVCEAAAILATDGGRLLMPKIKGATFTAAVAVPERYLTTHGGGHIEIVGAGPGDPELVSVRGRRMLEQADLILYAGSLVPRELTLCAKPGAVVRSSASMNLEEQCALMKEFYDRGAQIVRLHTGDPCIFGAIQEQMAFFDAHNMSYHITPGISSFLAAAAELRSQFTIPERCQTIILTRGEGRTPMPEREKLHLLARSQSTMCIFLSAAIVDDVQRELLQEYPEDTPVAACYHLTWPDQRIYRGVLRDLAKIIHDNHLTLTTMIVVGQSIDNRQGLSELYSKHFSHLFRK